MNARSGETAARHRDGEWKAAKGRPLLGQCDPLLKHAATDLTAAKSPEQTLLIHPV